MTYSEPTRDPDATHGPGVRALEWLNFLLADVQSIGPFIAAYLAANHWSPEHVGWALTLGGIVTLAVHTPAGAAVDAVRGKERLLAAGITALGLGAWMLARHASILAAGLAEVLIGAADPFLGPSVAAITLGLVGWEAFGRQFGRNQGFNSAGNIAAAVLFGACAYQFGGRAIFYAAAALASAALLVLRQIDPEQIDFGRAQGAVTSHPDQPKTGVRVLLSDRVLLAFGLATLLFHLANGAMLPQVGELLAHRNARTAPPVMAAFLVVTQGVVAASAAWIGREAGTRGRKPLLLVGFAALPIRGMLYSLAHAAPALIAIQLLDGVTNAILAVVSILVILDRTRDTGRFNLAQGALATAVGVGAALSKTVGGELIRYFGYNASFLGLALIGVLAWLVLWLTVPETLHLEALPAPSKVETSYPESNAPAA